MFIAINQPFELWNQKYYSNGCFNSWI